VAIKVIKPALANNPDFIRRFETEAQVVARLEHMNIVPLYDYWREPDRAFLVMRYLPHSLPWRLERGPLSLSETVRLVEQVSAALTVAHRHGVVHRDLKPANLLLDDEGNAFLADFGIAKVLGAAARITQEGALIGSPAYFSPEQVKGEAVTPASDLYSFGVLLYEALTGQHPFPGDLSPSTLVYKQLHEPLPSLLNVRPDLPAALDNVIQQATAKNPAERFADALALAAAFRQAAGQVVTPASEAPGVSSTTGVQFDAERTWTPADHLVAARNPYKGLRPFDAADADDFFGREVLTERLIARLGEEHPMGRFLAVVGPSGSGKSSVVKAGLIPALRRGALPDSDCWFMAEMLPGSHPLDELEITLLQIAARQPANLAEQLRRDERGLARAARLVLPEDGELLLVIDQFEEVFMLAEDSASARHFLDLIYTAVTDPRSQVRVIITLRADFYDRPLMYPDFCEMMRQRTEVVGPLAPAELEQVMVGPAQRVGVTVEPKLVAEVVREVGEQLGALPMLQYALTELFERRPTTC
jgi:hypothetical protein